MKLNTAFASSMASDCGIVSLMDDLGEALNANPDSLFLGGGNPAHIPEFETLVAQHLQTIAQDPEQLHRLIGVYQSPQGSESFIASLSNYFQQLGWPVSPSNIAMTHGSQSAFFLLINLLGGTNSVGQLQKICLPMVPEYIGYADQGLEENTFCSVKPEIETFDDHSFKYHIDFERVRAQKAIAALCVSCPTNPSANVLSKSEMDSLGRLADEQGIPLVVDLAYGKPFPGLVYKDITHVWQKNRIFVLSLSKLGLPGARTGIVIADKPIIQSITRANTIMSLANGNFGPGLMQSILQADMLTSVCENIVRPFYLRKRDVALAYIHAAFDGLSYFVHKAEGAFFLWLWFPELPISSTELYQRLKRRNVLVMDGAGFFFGHADTWSHAQQCIRLSYCQTDDVLRKAIGIIADEVLALRKRA